MSYFWMSNGGTASKLHIDTDENLLTVLHGSKDVVLISPKYSQDVYADEARILGVSEVNVSAVDLKKFPRVANVRYLVARLKVSLKVVYSSLMHGNNYMCWEMKGNR